MVKNAEEKPKPGDINTACHTLRSNMGKLTYQDRHNILEALKIRVHTGEAIRIEGVLPVASTAEESLELQLTRRG